MNTKKKALKALGIFAVVIALCIFFGQTVQTITTPKIQRVSAGRGKFEQRYDLNGSLYFSDVEDITVKEAEKMNVRLGTQYVRPGSYLKKGDIIFDAEVPEYEKKLEEAEKNYEKKVRELMLQRAENVRMPEETRQNTAYLNMLAMGDAYYETLYDLHVIADEENYTLPEDQETWAEITDAPEKTAEAIKKAVTAYDTYYEAYVTLRRFYTTQSYERVGDNTYDFVKKMDVKKEEIAEAERARRELEETYEKLSAIRAPHDGYLTAVYLKKGESYDGTKPIFSMSRAESVPVIRVEVTDIDKNITEDTKVTLSDDSPAKITEVLLAGDGKRFIHVGLEKDQVRALGGMNKLAAAENIPVSLRYRAKNSTTLLPASVVRSEGEKDYFVYAVQTQYGGMLSGRNYVVVKTPVTVIEKSDKVVSVQEDMSYMEFADREDRALSDGQAVMDYVN